MNRRSFLKRFAIAAVGVVLGANLISNHAEAVNVPTTCIIKTRPGINPAWLNAKYETSFVISEESWKAYEAACHIQGLVPMI